MPWCRHEMETLSALQAFCEETPPVTAGFPSQRPSNAVLQGFYANLSNCWINRRMCGDLRRHEAHESTAVLSGNTTQEMLDEITDQYLDLR